MTLRVRITHRVRIKNEHIARPDIARASTVRQCVRSFAHVAGNADVHRNPKVARFAVHRLTRGRGIGRDRVEVGEIPALSPTGAAAPQKANRERNDV